jgi:hypothetical protein
VDSHHLLLADLTGALQVFQGCAAIYGLPEDFTQRLAHVGASG